MLYIAKDVVHIYTEEKPEVFDPRFVLRSRTGASLKPEVVG